MIAPIRSTMYRARTDSRSTMLLPYKDYLISLRAIIKLRQLTSLMQGSASTPPAWNHMVHDYYSITRIYHRVYNEATDNYGPRELHLSPDNKSVPEDYEDAEYDIILSPETAELFLRDCAELLSNNLTEFSYEDPTLLEGSYADVFLHMLKTEQYTFEMVHKFGLTIEHHEMATHFGYVVYYSAIRSNLLEPGFSHVVDYAGSCIP